MIELLAVVFLLCGLLVYQQYFWAKQLDKTVNKLMSRNFAEYQQVQKVPEKPFQGKIKLPENLEDLRILEGMGPL